MLAIRVDVGVCSNQMLTALDKVLKSIWTLPANTPGALLHAAILATNIDGQLCWVWHVLHCVVHILRARTCFLCVHKKQYVG